MKTKTNIYGSQSYIMLCCVGVKSLLFFWRGIAHHFCQRMIKQFWEIQYYRTELWGKCLKKNNIMGLCEGWSLFVLWYCVWSQYRLWRVDLTFFCGLLLDNLMCCVISPSLNLCAISLCSAILVNGDVQDCMISLFFGECDLFIFWGVWSHYLFVRKISQSFVNDDLSVFSVRSLIFPNEVTKCCLHYCETFPYTYMSRYTVYTVQCTV